MPRTLTLAATAALLCTGLARTAVAQPPLHQRIDQQIASPADFQKIAARPSTDSEFLRRVYLDLAGMIPSSKEARAFLKDSSPNKRQELIDRLLAAPHFANHMTNVVDVWLMDRRPNKHVKKPEWQAYLQASFAANKPYDQLVREMLSADGADPKNRAPARFYLDRDAEPHQITRDISRLFLGMNLQCAQCHDHPLVESYKQSFYYGVYAYLNRSFLFKSGAISMLAEKAEGEVSYESVFEAKVVKKTGPRLPGGPVLTEPALVKGKEYQVAPKPNVRPIPAFSRRAQLARHITGPENKRFARASANRLWSQMLGRGIVHPIEFDHPENPPSHPELLDVLSAEFAQAKYDVKAFLKQIALSQTYQRSSILPNGAKDVHEKAFAVGLLRPLSPEQMAWSMMQATGIVDIERQALKGNEIAVLTKLAANEAPFVTLFGSTPGEPSDLGFQATLDQTLFLANGALVRGWLTPRAGNLIDRLSKLKTADGIAEELYLSVLTRLPSAEEKQEVADYLSRAADRNAALPDLTWALLASAEFRFNH